MLSNLSIRLMLVMISLIMLLGCRASGNHHAPIEDKTVLAIKPVKKLQLAESDARAQIHTVQKGDTLYSIAFENGMDYRDLAEKNNIENPAAIQIGQQIKLFPSDEVIREKTHVEPKLQELNTSSQKIKDQPKIYKIPYSEFATAKIEKYQLEPEHGAVGSTPKPVAVEKPSQEYDSGDNNLNWGTPTKGKVIGDYSESSNRKGIDISGSRGQSIMASEAGKVVYSGSGLRGYGKLVIIKHNKTFLSAYAHNEQLLVKEGQNVTKGQKIAEMGSTDSDQVKLHFEIRKFGKPVDPAKFLNFN